METKYILTSFKIDEEYYECQCGCIIEWNEDFDMFYTLNSWKYCPECGRRRTWYITEGEALYVIECWLADIDLDEYKNEEGLDYSSLEWDYRQCHIKNKVFYRSFDDFKKLIDKTCKIDKRE